MCFILPNVTDEPRRANYHGVSLARKAIEQPPVAALALATCSALRADNSSHALPYFGIRIANTGLCHRIAVDLNSKLQGASQLGIVWISAIIDRLCVVVVLDAVSAAEVSFDLAGRWICVRKRPTIADSKL
jgi:hypothetical protein